MFARDLLSVVAVLALLGAALWALRRGVGARLPGAFGKSRSIETLQRIALTPQHSLHLVRIHGRELLVATHPQGCALLLETSGRTE
jgi:flagellar biogenesis protein FliO